MRALWAPKIEPCGDSDRPFWSVMIPTYNSGPLLERTLTSVLAQDPGPSEMQIQVVDDCSTADDIEVAVKEIAGDRVEVYRHPRNVGAAANFTACVQRARGRWVHVLHSDDLVRPSFYERYRAAAAVCDGAAMIAAQTFTVDANERFLGITPPLPTVDGCVVDAAFTIATTHPLAAASVVVARDTYEAVGGFHPGLPHTNDWEMWTRAAAFGPVAWVEEPLALYRAHDASDSNRMHRTTRYLDECLEAAEVFSDYFPPERRAAVKHGAAQATARYAIAVSNELVGRRDRRLAIANAVRAVRIDHGIHTVAVAGEVVASALTAVARERLDRLRSRSSS